MYDPALMFTVVIAEKDGPERRATFTEAEVTIGRIPGNDVVLPKGNVSKRHSRIVLKDNRFIVVDLKSTNGTYVNGRKIGSPMLLSASDRVYVGDFLISFDMGGGAALPDDFPGAPASAGRGAAADPAAATGRGGRRGDRQAVGGPSGGGGAPGKSSGSAAPPPMSMLIKKSPT